jgi:hypothetical protein
VQGASGSCKQDLFFPVGVMQEFCRKKVDVVLLFHHKGMICAVSFVQVVNSVSAQPEHT